MLRHIGLTAAMLAIAPLAQAADNGIYLGAGYVQSDYGLEDPDIGDFDDEDSGYKLIAGWRVIDNFGVEVNYIDHGDATIGDGRLGAETISGFAVGYIDFPLIDLFAKAGATSWQVDARSNGVSVDEDDLDFAWGVGIQARIWSLGARLEYEQFPIVDDEKLDTISLSFTYTFLSGPSSEPLGEALALVEHLERGPRLHALDVAGDRGPLRRGLRHVARPAHEHRRHEVRGADAVAEQVAAGLRDLPVDAVERGLDARPRGGLHRLDAGLARRLVRVEPVVVRDLQRVRQEEHPALVGRALLVADGRRETGLRVALGQDHAERSRLAERRAVHDEGRHDAARVQLQVLGLAVFARLDVHLHLVVRLAELDQHPVHEQARGARGPIECVHGQGPSVRSAL